VQGEKETINKNVLRNLVLSSLAFIVPGIVGIIVINMFPGSLSVYSRPEDIVAVANSITSDNQFNVFVSLFINNAIISFIIITLGILRTKYIPSIIVAINGFIIMGLLSQMAIRYGWSTIFLSFLPHAMLEIPAIVISCTISFIAIDKLVEVTKENSPTWRDYLRADLKVKREVINNYIFAPFFKVVVPLLLTAAFLETYVSLSILKHMVIGL
jgi:stage II sporulation protein M